MSREQIDNIVNMSVEMEKVIPYKIALEGPVCSGKSTAIESIKANGVGVIVEYSEYVVSATRDFPKFPPTNEADAQDNFRFFLELEKRRAQDLKLHNNGQIIIDRSIYTLLAFEAGAFQLTGIDIMSWAVEKLANQKDIIIPYHIIYMDIDNQISKQRATEADIRIPNFLFDEKFNYGFKSFFVGLKEKIPSYVTIVDASQKQSEVLKKIEEKTSNLTK